VAVYDAGLYRVQLIAVALTAVGLFGLVSYEVNQRTREIGIRAAFGARSRNVVWLAVRHAASPTAIGLGLGLMASIVGTRALFEPAVRYTSD
jgi:ABC-type antimicrobial peptide transport system permease subunit